jgi:YihY family inner membrane protein
MPGEAKATTATLASFWAKISNDWIFNLAAMLAYNLLMSIFPLLAMLFSFFGLFLGGLAPAAQEQFISGLTNGIPGSGGELVHVALQRLAQSSGIFALISIGVSAWFGSRLFVAIDNCFGIIFRLPPRTFVRQNLIALVMLLIFAILIPVLLAVSALPSFLSTQVVQRYFGPSTAATVLLVLAGIVAGYIIACALFLAIYTVLPNRPLRVQDAWRGALIGGGLLELYIIGFPFYATHLLKPSSYGSTAGFAVLTLVFFYYFGIILLLGAEVNSFWAGQRQTATTLPGILYELQVLASAQGAAGPTAGHPQEDLQADHTGLDLTMTPAKDVLHPPGANRKKDRADRTPDSTATPGTPAAT